MIGETVGNFRIVSLLGKGGMGEVWLAENTNAGTRVAIKLLRRDLSEDTHQVQRLFNEAIAVSRIPHAGIVRISDSGFHAGQAYLVMELLVGETLHARIQRKGHLTVRALCEIGRQIVSVLAATHAAGVTHRDLKPDNIFLVPDAEAGERVKVLDFGLAKLAGNPAMTTTATSGMGTPLYMSPEQWRSAANVDGRADVYSLGCMLFEMACGRPPFEATSFAEACARHLTETPPRASEIIDTIPESLDALVAAMLAKHPADRPELPDVADALDTIGQGRRFALVRRISEPIESQSSANLVPAGARFGRNLVLGLVGLGLVGGAVAFLATRSHPDEPTAPVPSRPAAPTARGSAEDEALDAVFVSAMAVRRLDGELPTVPTGLDVQVCIDAQGRVVAVDTPVDIDADVTREVRGVVQAWHYAPYRADGVAVPACFPLHLAPPKRPGKPAPPRPKLVDAGVDAPPPDAAPIPDRLAAATIRAAIARIHDRLVACAAVHEPKELKINLAVSPEGGVSNVVVRPADDPLVACLTAELEKLTFGKSVQGGALRFTLELAGDDGSGSGSADPP